VYSYSVDAAHFLSATTKITLHYRRFDMSSVKSEMSRNGEITVTMSFTYNIEDPHNLLETALLLSDAEMPQIKEISKVLDQEVSKYFGWS